MGSTVELTAAAGHQVSAYAAGPNDAKNTLAMIPGILGASRLLRLAALCAVAGLAACATPVVGPASAPTAAQMSASPSSAAQAEQEAAPPDQPLAGAWSKTAHPRIGRSERMQVGKASFYAEDFDGKKMADGRRFSSTENVAASKTLPLGTTVKVTDLDTGKSAVVKVEDRGPLARGRVVDVSPKVAEKLNMKKKGTANVVVKPISVPQPNSG